MNFPQPQPTSSPSSSTTSSTTHPNNPSDPMHSWWESISKARTRISLLSSLLPPSLSISFLADTDRPARSLLSSHSSYSSITLSLSSPSSGSGSDPLCHWLYDTFLSADPDLRLVVLSYIPVLSGIYLSRIHTNSNNSLAGFEAVLLSIYASETKARNGKAVVVTLPDLNLPSLYHTPRNVSNASNNNAKLNVGANAGINGNLGGKSGVLCPPLEPQTAVKSTKRAFIVGVALDCYYKQISQMPGWSKLDFCRFVADWAGQDCECKSEFDEEVGDAFGEEIRVEEIDEVGDGIRDLRITENGESDVGVKGARIPLPWELLQPVLRILGHCLLGPLNSNEVKNAASVAVRCLYARASHELVPQALLATRSLIQLDKRARESEQLAAVNSASSNANTPSKAKKPEILLVSK
ncbi:Hyccin [Heracleum sosnowskyi]|uniref:Hyccin n=1 Tax=Heracleum sosnowskyi TaxID=360622 RepID=A0AAD8MW88_9APIA|nr:Hyccin [Heracleum sosnowskyi]